MPPAACTNGTADLHCAPFETSGKRGLIFSKLTRRLMTGYVASVPHGKSPSSPIGGCVQPPLQKFFHSLSTQITCISLAIPAHTEGRFAIVTDVGHGMR